MVKVTDALFVLPLDVSFSDERRRFSSDSNRFTSTESSETHKSFVKRPRKFHQMSGRFMPINVI